MPVEKPKAIRRIIIIVVLVLLFVLGKCSGSRAENYGPDMPPTFNPNDPLPTDEPGVSVEPTATPAPAEEDPSFPPLLAPGNSLRLYNLPGLMWYDSTADAYKLKRAYGSVVNLTVPFALSACPSSTATATSSGITKTYKFSLSDSLISETTTQHDYDQGLFQFFFYNIFNAGQVVSPNALYYTFNLNDFRLYCSDPQYTYFPYYQVITVVYYGNSNSNITTRDVIYSDPVQWPNDGQGSFISVNVPNERPGLSILGVSIRIRFGTIDSFNSFPVSQRAGADPYYFYDCSSYDVTVVWSETGSAASVEHTETLNFFSQFLLDLKSFFQGLFIPTTQQVQDWISSHNVALDQNHPLFLVRTLFTNLVQMLTSRADSSPPTFTIPALTFNVGGQSVTPFTGYTFNLSDADIPISGGTTLFYWSRLFGSMAIVSGLLEMVFVWFDRVFDQYYAASAVVRHSSDHSGGDGL